MTTPNGLAQGTWTLDGSHSEIGFTVRHAGISKVRGSFSNVDAQLEVGADLADFRTVATIRTESFDSNDGNRDTHVKGPDFFDVEQYPEMTFVSAGVKGGGEDYVLAGDLTIRGVTRPVEINAEFNGVAVDPFGATRAGFSGQTVISRKEFGLTYNAALEAGGVLIGDKVTINVDAAFIAPSA